MFHSARYRGPMTTTDLVGLPAEIAAALARAGLTQDAACELAGVPRTSYYRRKAFPGAWTIDELREFVGTAGVRLEVDLASCALDLDALRGTTWRLGELSTLARAMGSGLSLVLEPAVAATGG